MAKVKVTQVRSQIGQSEKHRGTLRALGLGRIGKTAEPHIVGKRRAEALWVVERAELDQVCDRVQL